MWYLTRKPSNLPSDQELITSRTSIFSCDYGVFEDLCFLLTEDEGDEEEKSKSSSSTNPWQWFAYECLPMQFLAVAVPRQTQIIHVFPDYFLCAQLVFPSSKGLGLKSKPQPYAKLCTYLRKSNELFYVPSCMELAQGHDRDLLSAACALIDGWLYVAGGYKASSADAEAKPSTPLNSAERLNLVTLKWETLPAMLKPQAHSTGISHMGRFYVIGDENYGHSSQVYDPALNKWFLATQFIPQEATGYSVGSVDGLMILLTWSDVHGIKLWQWVDCSSLHLTGRWKLIHFYSDNKAEKDKLGENGAKLLRVGKELFIMVGVNRNFCWVDGLCAWPLTPAPFFRPSDGHRAFCSGYVHAFSVSILGNRVLWRQHPLYRIRD